MALYRIDNCFPMFTGQPEDIVLNSIHVESTLNHEQFALSVEVFMNPFWETIYGTTASLRASYIDWPEFKYRTFDLSAPAPRVPIETSGPWSSAGTEDTDIPTEVAVVASFQSVGIPGEVFQRRYNRIYLGCLPSSAITPSTSSSFPLVGAGFTVGVINAMEALAAALPGPDNLWVQVSRAATGSPRSLPVVGGWVDNSPDTQRRRSVDSTARVTWPTA